MTTSYTVVRTRCSSANTPSRSRLVATSPGRRRQRANSRCTSAHHQSVDAIGAGLRVTGWSADGCVEAIEPIAPHPFALAVQWHPEMTAEDDPAQQALFDAARGGGGIPSRPCIR